MRSVNKSSLIRSCYGGILCVWLPVLFPLLSVGQTGENFIHSYTAREESAVEETILSGGAASSYQTVNLFDGLGRPILEIRRNASDGTRDIIYPIAYDNYGRQVKTFLPYPDSPVDSKGHFRPDALSKQGEYYSNRFNGDRHGYAENAMESSPLQRLEKQAAPGQDWKMGSGKEIKFYRRTNTEEDAVRVFTLDSMGLPQTHSTYAANELWVEMTDNEDNNRTLAFTDKRGRILLKKVQDTATHQDNGHKGWLCTYYVYDDFGNLAAVIPPKAVRILDTNGFENSTSPSLVADQYFTYTYDSRSRMIEKKLPGKEKEYLLYDRQDRLVASQDGEMRKENKWLYTKYDALGREVMTGLMVDERDRETLQKELTEKFPDNHVRATGNRRKIRFGDKIVSQRNDGYEQYVAKTAITLKPGFHFKATNEESFAGRIGKAEKQGAGGFPAEEGAILTQSYYDSYDATPAGLFKGRPGFPRPSTNIKGLLAAREVKNLTADKMYATSYFYDEKGRVIQTLEEHQVGGTVRISYKYNFEGQLMATYTEFNTSGNYTIAKYYDYNLAGLLSGISHQINDGPILRIVNYGYNELGEKSTVTFPDADASHSYTYSIRGWLKEMDSSSPQLFKMSLKHQETGRRWDGNITQAGWRGQDGVTRRYAYSYDKTGRITGANYRVPSLPAENARYNLSNISYDENGNLKTMTRRGQFSPDNYQVVNDLEYFYASDPTFGEYSNQLIRVRDQNPSQRKASSNVQSGENYEYDANGNQVSQSDKYLTKMSYNHLNLPETMMLSSGEKMQYTYDAEGRKRQQLLVRNQQVAIRTDYIGDFILVNGQLDHVLHEEGRVVFEGGKPRYEYFIKDHLGNVRQVIRAPERETIVATMEMPVAKEEEQQFEQIAKSRQLDAKHNATPGGNRVAWLNAERGRILGPATTREVTKGGKVALQVHAKYEAPLSDPPNAGQIGVWGSKPRLIANLQEFGKVSSQPLSMNPFWLLSMVDLLGKSLQTKEAPEAYMMYALYDQDSICYATGKQVLTKNAANRHEILEEEVYIAEDGYIQAFVVNETEENVWFDDFTVTTEHPNIVQETHYDPWGLELKGLGYQDEEIKENRYLYNGKEHIPDLDLNFYDYGARMYDPVLGRWNVVDPYSEAYFDHSPYNYGLNNPIRFIDEDGNYVVKASRNRKNELVVTAHRIKISQAKTHDKMAGLPVIGLAGYAVKALYAWTDPSYNISAADHIFAGLNGAGVGTVRMVKPFSSFAANILEAGFEGAGQMGSRAVENDYSELFLDKLTFEVFENSGIASAGIGQADRSLTFTNEYVNKVAGFVQSNSKKELSGRRLDNAVQKEINARLDGVKGKLRGLSGHFDLSTLEGQTDFRFVLNSLSKFEEDDE